MIISVSYKTDIPAFYGEWFLNRLNAGFCRMVNPYNKKRHYKVSLAQSDIDGFVFWTKNITPFLPILKTVQERGYPFIVQYTINNYPRELENRVVDAKQSIKNMHLLSTTYGAKVAVWRYDTIILSSLTDIDFHKKNFLNLAQALEGSTDEVVISFVQLYKKTLRNMDLAATNNKFSWYEANSEIKKMLVQELAEISAQHGIRLTICSQPEFIVGKSTESRCVDVDRLSIISGKNISAKLQGNRPQCGCFFSKDIGDYDTCPHGCVYCYAVQNRELALKRYKSHNPYSEYLFEPETPNLQLELL